MDSNSFDMFCPKVELDNDDSTYDSPGTSSMNSQTRKKKFSWTPENTGKMIRLLERDCKELWDAKNPFYKDRVKRKAKLEYLGSVFGTTSEEISRKIHNLRTQFNHELRKIKRKAEMGEESPGTNWEYFELLSFLSRQASSSSLSNNDPLDYDEVNIELAEFQAEEEETFAAARAFSSEKSNTSFDYKDDRKPQIRVAASAPPPLPPSAHPMMWAEEPLPRLRPGNTADECQIFGDFVASELRTLRSDESRKRLKRVIQRAILDIGEEEDMNGK